MLKSVSAADNQH
jgi:hypothetical protein